MIQIIIISVITYLLYKWWAMKPKGLPPGPPYLPVVGSIPFIQVQNIHFYLEKARQKFGPIIGMKFGFGNVVAFCGPQEVVDALKMDELQGRPKITFASEKAVKGIVLTEGPFWSTQRRFTLRHLRDFGFGKTSTEGLILDEIEDFFKYRFRNQTQVQMSHLFNSSVINVLWAVMAGTRFSHDDDKFKTLLDVLEKTFRSGGFSNRTLFLKRLIRQMLGLKNRIECDELLYEFMQNTIDEHRRTRTDTPRDFIDSYLMEIEKQENPDFNELSLISICLDLFAAGAESVGNTITFCIMYMVLYPEIQKELQEEIDDVIGKNKISLNDKPRLPKLEAFWSEVSRVNTIAPVAVPRRAMKDINYKGYLIPQNTFIIVSIWCLFRDKQHWGDPENFRPSRFLNAEGQYVKDEWLAMFGIGKRVCPGESLARNILFLFLTSLIQGYEFSIPEGHPKPSTLGLPGFTSAPQPFEVSLKERN